MHSALPAKCYSSLSCAYGVELVDGWPLKHDVTERVVRIPLAF